MKGVSMKDALKVFAAMLFSAFIGSLISITAGESVNSKILSNGVFVVVLLLTFVAMRQGAIRRDTFFLGFSFFSVACLLLYILSLENNTFDHAILNIISGPVQRIAYYPTAGDAWFIAGAVIWVASAALLTGIIALVRTLAPLRLR